jgi:endo-1,4-beta-xylanase
MLNRRRFVELAGLGAAAPWLAGCAKKVGVRSGAAPALAQEVGGGNSLKAHAAAKGLLYGCAVNVGLLGRDAAYERLVVQQAGIVVAENSMKFGPMRPSPTEFRWDDADKLLAFAEANGMKVRGHNLSWHRQIPRWFDGYATKDNAAGLLTSHIEAVVTRYKGRIQSWDVVNEAVLPSDGRSDGLRETPWLKLAGPGYIELAFRTARAADPAAKLTYNDYGIEAEDEASSKKRAAVLDLVKGLHAQGLIDAVGVQSHISAGGDYGRGLAEFLDAVQGLGLEIYVTEMDVNDRQLAPDDATRDKAVAATYRGYLDLVLKNPALKSVLTWGITDEFTWLNGEDARADHLPERCLPFDKELKPVEAYFATRDAFDAKITASSRRTGATA